MREMCVYVCVWHFMDYKKCFVIKHFLNLLQSPEFSHVQRLAVGS